MSKVAKTTIGLMFVTIFSKLFGFARELVLTYMYGASNISDVYITSMSIPTILFATIGAAIGTTFIPLFFEIDNLKNRDEALKFTNNIFNIVIILGVAISIFTFIFTQPVVKIFAMNFSGDKLSLAIDFTKIMIFGVLFIGLSNIMTAWLQINGDFSIPGMIGCPFNIFIMIGIILSSRGNLNIMAIGTLIGLASQFLFQLPFAIKKGFRYKLYINLKDQYLKKMLKLILPVFIGVGVNQINTIVDKSLASTLQDGSITVLNSANRLNGFVLSLFIATIAAVIYPMLSRYSNENNEEKFIESVSVSINSVVLLMIPVSIGAIALADPVVRVIFERGAFDVKAAHMTSVALICYSIGMLGFGIREILNKIFYSIKDTKTPMINGGLEVVFNILLNLLFINIFGYAGLALATSISTIITVGIFFISLRKKIGYFGEDKILKTTMKSLISGAIMGILVYITYTVTSKFLGTELSMEIISLGISFAVGLIVYLGLIVTFKVKEVNFLIDKIKRKKTSCN
ncbi:transmembrane virulence factor MviN family protein [[Clostridium] sordellii]|uniref:murein biosynthesis integral membrane protein MurJ n=1 Tax=Paraclostridium sordellii TaxID=1505 RepID=UPI0005DD9020|nr:murein biosynthesis integral membrane protein MurJ [Paeniclostridium sordellii]CEN91455.1 transmembrane virulence factor MviN family protein [[Clostridium] sordellii] [Paeniclostridium sordellii]